MFIFYLMDYFYKTDDDPVCIRCDVVLDTAEGFQTGICANCWKPETDEEVEFVDGEWKPKLPLTT